VLSPAKVIDGRDEDSESDKVEGTERQRDRETERDYIEKDYSERDYSKRDRETRRETKQRTATRCNLQLLVAGSSCVLQCVAVCCGVLHTHM